LPGQTHEVISIVPSDAVVSFPQDDPIFSREAGQKGWNYIIRRSLKAFPEALE
jgi:hypothetical protein